MWLWRATSPCQSKSAELATLVAARRHFPTPCFLSNSSLDCGFFGVFFVRFEEVTRLVLSAVSIYFLVLLEFSASDSRKRYRLAAAMETACGVQWTSLSPGCSQLGKVSRIRSRFKGGFTSLSSGANGCFGVRKSLQRSVDLSVDRCAPCDSRRAAVVIASVEHSDKELRLGPAKVGLAFLVGNLLMQCTARAESIPNFLVDAAGGNVNGVITALCIAEAVALTGAIVGGVIARQRRNEILNINTQLRQINLNLRRQARVESYAPSLMYAPPAGRSGVAIAEPVDQPKEKVTNLLKSGKRSLRELNPAQAFVEFERAYNLAKRLSDAVEEKKAARGMGAACQRQRKFKEAIKYHQLVLMISEKTKEQSGNTEAYGAIGDCYSEIGELELAAKYYDMYIDRLQNEDVD